jgi:hypothetical protein
MVKTIFMGNDLKHTAAQQPREPQTTAGAFFKIQGGNPISGEITPQGNKNEALPALAA